MTRFIAGRGASVVPIDAIGVACVCLESVCAEAKVERLQKEPIIAIVAAVLMSVTIVSFS